MQFFEWNKSELGVLNKREGAAQSVVKMNTQAEPIDY